MQAKRKPILCQILIMFLVIMGIYLESPKVDPYFACVAADRPVSYIGLPEAEICEVEPCMAEVMGNRSSSISQRLVARTGTKTNTKISLAYLCQESVSHAFSTFYTAVDNVQSPDLYHKAVVLHYIHNQDGKK